MSSRIGSAIEPRAALVSALRVIETSVATTVSTPSTLARNQPTSTAMCAMIMTSAANGTPPSASALP